MAKAISTQTIYDIKLDEKEYSFLKNMFINNFGRYCGKPELSIALKILTLEDVLLIYNINKEYLIENGFILED